MKGIIIVLAVIALFSLAAGAPQGSPDELEDGDNPVLEVTDEPPQEETEPTNELDHWIATIIEYLSTIIPKNGKDIILAAVLDGNLVFFEVQSNHNQEDSTDLPIDESNIPSDWNNHGEEEPQEHNPDFHEADP